MSAQPLAPFLAVPVVVLLTACTARTEAPRTDRTVAPPVVSLTATDYAFDAPDTVPAGFTTVRLINRGEHVHLAHIIRLDAGRTVQELVDAYAAAIRTRGPRPTWIKRFGGPEAEPGAEGNATQYLEPGSYVWICPVDDSTGTPHFAKGMAKPFVVRGARGDAAHRSAPKADLSIRLLDYTFAINPPLSAGRHVIRVENAGTESHDIALLKVAPGKTMEDLQRYFREPQGPMPAHLAGGVAPIAPGLEAFFETELTSGDYLLLCFSTSQDGRSHIERGMVLPVHVG